MSVKTETLAIDGGTPVRSEPFAPWPHFDDDAVGRVSRVLRSGQVNYWTGGEGKAFEQEFAAMCGARHAVAVANGTLALEVALEALGIGAGDEVVVTPRTFLASASAIVRQGAIPVFADVDRDSQNISARTIEPVLTPNTKAVLPVHLGGWPCAMDEIGELASRRGLAVIEDCAQAIGATVDGRHVGTFGDVGCHSFCQDKIMTTAGEGGMIVTDDESLWNRIWSLKDHGKSHSEVFSPAPPPQPYQFRWLHHSFGTNARMTEAQSAVGRLQLERLDDWVATRRRHAATLIATFQGIDGLRTPTPGERYVHSYYKCYTFLRPERLRADWSRERILAAINAEGVPCFSGSCSEIYRERAFSGTGFAPQQRLPVAAELGDTSLMFLVHPTLGDDAIEDTCRAVEKVFAAALD